MTPELSIRPRSSHPDPMATKPLWRRLCWRGIRRRARPVSLFRRRVCSIKVFPCGCAVVSSTSCGLRAHQVLSSEGVSLKYRFLPGIVHRGDDARFDLRCSRSWPGRSAARAGGRGRLSFPKAYPHQRSLPSLIRSPLRVMPPSPAHGLSAVTGRAHGWNRRGRARERGCRGSSSTKNSAITESIQPVSLFVIMSI